MATVRVSFALAKETFKSREPGGDNMNVATTQSQAVPHTTVPWIPCGLDTLPATSFPP